MRGPPTSDLDQRREEQLELVHARQKSQAKASPIAISPSNGHRISDVQQRGGSVPMYDPRDRVFSSSNPQHVSEPPCAFAIVAARGAPTVRSCAGARSAVFLIGNRDDRCAQRFQPTRGDAAAPRDRAPRITARAAGSRRSPEVPGCARVGDARRTTVPGRAALGTARPAWVARVAPTRGAGDRVGNAHCPDRGHPVDSTPSVVRGVSCRAATTAQPIVWRITR